jgi:hypothetical protein
MTARKAALEDASHQAGWMFADLLLALMVIFLAAQSFVPKEASLPTFSALLSNKTSLQGTVAPLKTSITLTSIDESALIIAMQNYGAIEHLPAEYTVESMVIAGGFNPKTESSDRGTATALQYAAAIGSFNLPYFKNSATLLAASSEVPDGAVILNLQITPVAPIGGGSATASANPSAVPTATK